MADQYTITLSDGVTSFDIYPLEENGPGNSSTPRRITSVSLTGGAGTNYFQLHSDMTYRFVAGFTFTVVDSYNNNNDGTYTVVGGGSSYSGGYTNIPVVETISDDTAPYGSIYYSIPTAENETSLLLPGRGVLNYGETFATDFAHLLENFAHSSAPSYPVPGQLWFKSSSDELYVRDSTNSTWNNILAGAGGLASAAGFYPVKAVQTSSLPDTPTPSGSGAGKTISSTSTGSAYAINPDGVTIVSGDRILLANGTSADNGIYDVTQQASDATPETSLFTFLDDAGGQSYVHTIEVLASGDDGFGSDPGWDQNYIQWDGHFHNGTLSRFYLRFTWGGAGYGGGSPANGYAIPSIVNVVVTDTAADIATRIYNALAGTTGTDNYIASRSMPTSTKVQVTCNRRGTTWSGDSDNIGSMSLSLCTVTEDTPGVNTDYEGKYLTCGTTTNDYYYWFTSAQFSPPNNPFPGGYNQTSHSQVTCAFMENASAQVGVAAAEIAQQFKSQIGADSFYFSSVTGASDAITVTRNVGGDANDGTVGDLSPHVTVYNTQGGGATGYILTRATDFDGSTDIYSGMLIPVSQGTLYADTIFSLTTNGEIVIDSTALAFDVYNPDKALDDLSDVVITSVADNEVLAYDSGGNWINQTAAEAGLATASQGSLADSALQDVVDDTTPQLGGDLDVNGNSLVSTSNGDINLTPNGTGNVSLGVFTFNADQSIGAPEDNYVLTYDDASGTIGLEVVPGGGVSVINDLTDVTITSVATDDMLVYSGGNWINTPAPEYIQDAIGTAITNGTQSGIVVTYTDGSDAIDFEAAPDYEEFSASASQTVFNTTLATTANGSGKSYLQVFVNGVYQQEGASKAYQVTGANQITFNAGLTASDDVVIYSFDI